MIIKATGITMPVAGITHLMPVDKLVVRPGQTVILVSGIPAPEDADIRPADWPDELKMLGWGSLGGRLCWAALYQPDDYKTAPTLTLPAHKDPNVEEPLPWSSGDKWRAHRMNFSSDVEIA